MKAAAQNLRGRQQRKVQDETADARIRRTLKEEERSSGMKQKSRCSIASKRWQLVLETDVWLSQCSSANRCTVETTDARTRLHTDDCETKGSEEDVLTELSPMVASQRQWQRQSEGWTKEALALMEGCTNEALTQMVARRRQWEGCAAEALTPMVARQGAVEWMHGWSLHTRSLEDGKRTTVARIRWTRRQEGQDAAIRLKLMLGSHRANFYVLHRINQVDHKKKKEKERMPAMVEEKKRKKKKKRELVERRLQFTLTHKASHPFYRGGIRKKP